MFGLGITEIIFIAILAIVVLGPDKLPTAMVEIAKFFKSFKKTVTDAKSAIDNELNLTELKESAKEYQKNLDNTREQLVKSLGKEEAEKEMANIKNMLNIEEAQKPIVDMSSAQKISDTTEQTTTTNPTTPQKGA